MSECLSEKEYNEASEGCHGGRESEGMRGE